MRIFLVRHAQSTSDIENRYGGAYDDHLTDHGRQEATELAQSLTNKGIEHIYSSPRLRAKETADIVARQLRMPVTVVDDLRERNYASMLSGMDRQEALAKYPNEVAKLAIKHGTATGGEEYEQLKQRVVAAFEQIKTAEYQTVAIISHGGPIRCLAREVLGMGELGDIVDCQVFELEV